jgi:small-conductance mechanosensitive channel
LKDILSHSLNYYWPSIAVALGTYAAFWIFKNVLIIRLRKISVRTSTYLDDVALSTLEKTKHFFILATSIYASFQLLHLDKEYGHIADNIYLVCVAIQVIIWGTTGLNSWFELGMKKKVQSDPSVQTTFGILKIFLKFILFSIVFLFTLNNLGINISTFIAGLGVGGVAIALATQNILGDLFSSLSIVLDKPFMVGDFISMGEWMGTVENVGLKTTRLRSITGEQVVISNSDLLSSRIRNFKRMIERRIVLKLGVTYQTKRSSLEKAPALLEEIIKTESLTRFDRAHFTGYGDFSLNFEAVYWCLSPEMKTHLDVQQRILLKIHEAFEANDLEFAYPTQTVFLNKAKES